MGAMTIPTSKQESRTGESGRYLTDDPQRKLRAKRLGRFLLEFEEYEHDVLYPLASQNLAIELDDDVKANYSKFGKALKKFPGLVAAG